MTGPKPGTEIVLTLWDALGRWYAATDRLRAANPRTSDYAARSDEYMAAREALRDSYVAMRVLVAGRILEEMEGAKDGEKA